MSLLCGRHLAKRKQKTKRHHHLFAIFQSRWWLEGERKMKILQAVVPDGCTFPMGATSSAGWRLHKVDICRCRDEFGSTIQICHATGDQQGFVVGASRHSNVTAIHMVSTQLPLVRIQRARQESKDQPTSTFCQGLLCRCIWSLYQRDFLIPRPSQVRRHLLELSPDTINP